MTLTEKILARHAGQEKVEPGDLILAKVDFAFASDLSSQIGIQLFKDLKITEVFDRERVGLIPDHFAPNKDIKSAEQSKLMREFAREYGIVNYFEIGRMGIEHVLLPDEGLVVPGDLVIGGDSHTCTYGALCAFSTGVGSTDLAAAMISGEVWLKVPTVDAHRAHRQAGEVGGGQGRDPRHHREDRSGRGPVPGDGVRGRGDRLPADGVALHDVPTWRSRRAPRTASSRSTRRPGPMRIPARSGSTRSSPSTRTRATTGSCTSIFPRWSPRWRFPISPGTRGPSRRWATFPWTRWSSAPARTAGSRTCAARRPCSAGRKIHDAVRMLVFPATQEIYLKAIREGLVEVFVTAGAAFSTPTCGPCVGGHMGVLAKGERAVSTTNRNFVGRMGHPESEVYLANPAIAAASAVLGRIGSPDEIR